MCNIHNVHKGHNDVKGGNTQVRNEVCVQTGDSAAQRGEQTSSDVEETGGASQRDFPQPWPY